MQKKRSRLYIIIIAALLVLGGLVFAFWPQPVLVDIGQVRQGDLVVTIQEEGSTRVHDAYIVSTPVGGRLLRVAVEPGDEVISGETVLASMLPASPLALDVRSREQARAAVSAAEAALRMARANVNVAIADASLAETSYARAATLLERNLVAEAVTEGARREMYAAQAARVNAETAIAMREAELDNVRAQLIGFDDQGLASAMGSEREDAIPLIAPASGRILRVLQQSETTLPAGTPIMEIGDIEHDLEIVVELLSTDAVQVDVGDRVIIDHWGGEGTLSGRVARVDPFGFPKYSALGVEEQRVRAIIDFSNPNEQRVNLGHGFRVEAQIVVWEEQDVVIVPAGALFRDGDAWAVFVKQSGAAVVRHVEITRSNGIEASVAAGLQPGDQIVLYPSSGLEDGALVAQRITH